MRVPPRSGRRDGRRRIRTLSCVLGLLLALVAGPLRAEYLLSPGDTLLLRALRWNATAATHESWQGLTGEYAVGPDGWISVPLVGDLRAAGATTRALADEIGTAVQRRVGTPEPPIVALEVTGHMPVYVLGAAVAPGAHPYRPGLTVQQLVALSGGHAGTGSAMPRALADEAERLEGEVQRLSSRIVDLDAQRRGIATELARLRDAQDAGRPDGLGPTAPRHGVPETAPGAGAGPLPDPLPGLAPGPAAGVAEAGLRERQVAAMPGDALRSLAGRAGAAPAEDARTQALQREILRLAPVRQPAGADRGPEAARAARLDELEAIEGEIADTRVRLVTARSLRDIALSRAGAALAGAGQDVPVYRVTRRQDGQVETLELGPADLLRPGDTLEILTGAPAAGRSAAGD